MIINLFDSLTKKTIKTLNDNINIYNCGITPYKQSHIGNLRPAIITNIIENIYKQYKYQCQSISNITDIAWSEELQSINQQMELLTKENYVLFMHIHWKTYIKTLIQVINNIPKIYPASNFIKQNIEHIKKIQEQNYTITKEDGIYLDIDKCNIDTTKLINKGKRIKQFTIWRNKKNSIFQEKEFNGIPGWHIECFSIINSVAQTQKNNYKLEIHIGGIDLMDIHHNCEIIHHYAEYKNYKLAKIWLHINSLLVDGEKMSKRLNNIITLEEILKKINISEFMILILSTHYQKTININNSNIQLAKNRFKKIVKNFLTKIITYKKIINIYNLINYIDHIKNSNHKYKENIKILEDTLLINNLNTTQAIMFLQTCNITCEQDIYNFYIIDNILNTQILCTIINSIKENLHEQYLYNKKQHYTQKKDSKNEKIIDKAIEKKIGIQIKINNIEVII